jgi:hypothetical protein
MRHFRSFLPLLFLTLLYWGCQKSDNNANHSVESLASKPTTTTINVPENVAAKTIATDSLITNPKQLAALFASTPSKTETDGVNSPDAGGAGATYEGYTKTYDCSTNNWTYVFTWRIQAVPLAINFVGTGELTTGSFSTSAAFKYVSVTHLGALWEITIQYTLTVPNDANYCNSSTLDEAISFTYTESGTPESGAASNTESADPNVYQTYSDLVGGFSPNGNGTFTLDVVPGVAVCGTACHTSALGFPPTVTFYYSLVGSTTWQSYSQAGDDLNEFFIQLPAAGTYQYYTQEDTAPGVLSGELSSGTITVQ